VVLDPGRNAPPVVSLDSDFFSIIEDFEARFPKGAPSLRQCDSLTVRGDVEFGGDVICDGEVRIVATGTAMQISSGALLRGEMSP
jgi:UTP--glucose-1-phosphate uridylyltransferase